MQDNPLPDLPRRFFVRYSLCHLPFDWVVTLTEKTMYFELSLFIISKLFIQHKRISNLVDYCKVCGWVFALLPSAWYRTTIDGSKSRMFYLLWARWEGVAAILRVVYPRFFSTRGVNSILMLMYCLCSFLLASQTFYLLCLRHLLAKAHPLLTPYSF